MNNWIDPVIREIVSHTEFKYSYDFCLEICFQIHVLNACKCYELYNNFYLKNTTVGMCSAKNETDCVSKFYNQIFFKNDFLSENCQFCSFECEKVIYDLVVFNSVYPTKFYVNSVGNDPSFIKLFGNQTDFTHDLKNNLLKLNIFFESISVTRITESSSVNFISLVSNVGGTLGLFLGVSVLSFAEFFDIILSATLLFYDEKIKPKKKVAPNQS
jgi:hypothetical protein